MLVLQCLLFFLISSVAGVLTLPWWGAGERPWASREVQQLTLSSTLISVRQSESGAAALRYSSRHFSHFGELPIDCVGGGIVPQNRELRAEFQEELGV